MSRSGSIYVLVDPRDELPHYVGETMLSLDERLGLHLSDGRSPRRCESQKGRWIAELSALGLRPSIRAVERCTSSHSELKPLLRDREAYWVSALFRGGAPLKNQGLDPSAPALSFSELKGVAA